jgi:1,4-alpha-glucan branching enzyme
MEKKQLKVIDDDSYLKSFESNLEKRQKMFREKLDLLEKNEGGLINFCKSYEKLPFEFTDDCLIYREYAPNAKRLSIFGEFNNWNRDEYYGDKDEFGFFCIKLPNKNGKECLINHNTRLRISITLPDGGHVERNPAWSRYLIQNKDNIYEAVFWNPTEKYQMKNSHVKVSNTPMIYECHIGMGSSEERICTNREFADNVLPRIKSCGYNIIQIMAIMEHPYYGSFGYHVSNYFAISSRFGTPDDLKYLIDKAHSMGLSVLMDLVHSHAASNVLDGINYFDGTDYIYFHSLPRGYHSLWDSRLFNYENYETMRFLLNNIAFYMNEYMFDGFRFDGVTSMLYVNHGILHGFTGDYNEYFNENYDESSGVYLMLTNYLIKSIWVQEYVLVK